MILLAFGAWLAYSYLFNSPHFSIKKVEMTPTTNVERAELITLAGLRPGINIFRLSPGSVAKRLVAHPWVRSASVSRVLPDTLRIKIREQEAKAAVLFSGLNKPCSPAQGTCLQTPFYLINDGGEVFKRALPAELHGKVVITGVTRARYKQDPFGTRRMLKRALGLWDLYRQNRARPAISELFLEGDVVTLFLKSTGTAVHLDIHRFATLMDTFDSFLGGIEGDLSQFSEVYMDNRESPDRVVCIPHKLPEAEPSKDEQREGEKKIAKKIVAKKVRHRGTAPLDKTHRNILILHTIQEINPPQTEPPPDPVSPTEKHVKIVSLQIVNGK